jgi:3-hydroxybutyrate dehydrogenase
MSLEGKCALITGSTQGLGLAAAEQFAAAGCHLVLSGLARSEAVAAIRARLQGRYRVRTLYSSADLRAPDQIAEMMTAAAATFGAIDILVNNAVVRHVGAVDAMAAAHWDEAIAVNLSAAFHTIRLAVPAMKRRNWGRIINVSSIYGLRGAPNRVGYVTTKTALIGLTRAVALETAGHDVTCNAVCPGTTRTPVHEASLNQITARQGLPAADAERTLLAGKQPTGRLIGPDSVAALMVFLCGPHAADITGAVLPIDGGWSAA